MVALLCPECGNDVRQGAKFCDKCGFPLGQKLADITFGRSRNCDVRFESPKVSRQHARAVLVDRVWYLQDLESTNGTFVNDEKIVPNQWCKVPIGAIVKFADVRLKLFPEGWQKFETGEWVWKQKIPTSHPNSCPHCRTQLPEPFLLAFCPACGFSLRWLEVTQQQTFQINVRRPQTLKLNLDVKGIGSEPLEVTVKSLTPERLKFEVDGLETEVASWQVKAGEKISLTLLPNLPSGIEQPCECTLLIQSIFASSKTETERSQWQPSELVEERKITVRLEPIFVKLELQPPLLLFSERRSKQELKLVNRSPIAASGTIDCPDELEVQPLKWQLESNESLTLKVSARKSWEEGKGLILKFQPEDGDPIECHAFWFGQEQETLLMPDVVVGVDFGTSKSAIAFKRHDSKDVELLKVQGEETVPSILLFLPDRREPLIGLDARARLGDPTALSIQGIKLLLRTNLQVEWQGRTWTPQQLAQEFLRFLKRQVDENFGDDKVCVKRFELSLPVLEDERGYEEQRRISLQAAKEGGMEWVRAWWEPVCAAIWVLHRWQDYAPKLPLPKPGDWILVLDWGAGTLDAAVLIYEQNRPPFFQLPPFLGVGLEKGGNFLDWQLTCEFLERAGLTELLREAKELDWKQFRWKGSLALRQLAEAVRQGKESVSQVLQPMQYTVSNARRWLTEPVFVNLNANLPLVTTVSLDKIAKQVLDELKAHLDSCLGNDGWSEIDYAFIVGGSGQMEIVGNIVGEWLGRMDRVVQLRGRDAILAVAFGAAVLSDVQIDALPLGLNLQVGDETLTLLRAGDSITRIERRFQVPLRGLKAKLLANIGEQIFTLATFNASREISPKLRLVVYVTNDRCLAWRWIDEEKKDIIHDEQLIALP
ncbi:MAG: FHA domain-containing protein [Armatimonadetes bacterium]|nr:FHA domain-containing protein [Armatimonadota bacterium]MDW8029448.1 FHA domain-containing protein [Armatimonadota bacterium]